MIIKLKTESYANYSLKRYNKPYFNYSRTGLNNAFWLLVYFGENERAINTEPESAD